MKNAYKSWDKPFRPILQGLNYYLNLLQLELYVLYSTAFRILVTKWLRLCSIFLAFFT